MAKQKNEKAPQINETKKKNVNKNKTNKPNKSKKGVFNKKQTKSNTSKTQKERKPQRNKAPKKPDVNIRIAFLGGLNEVGKNMTLYECQNDMILVDCGLAFPEPDMLGVDLVIPDFTYVEQNVDKIKGIFITHGHEDHIGGLAYLLQRVNIPVYGTKLTIGLIEGKLKEHKILDKADLHVIEPKDKVNLGCFEVEAIHVNHSIPDALALAINSPAGLILQTGDFKIDTTPIDGDVIDLARIAKLGEKGVLCLLADSTNAQRPGYTASERTVGESFARLFQKADGKRLIVATFASNIHRVQQIIDVAKSVGRKVALSGRSLENVVETASKLGYLNVPEGILVSIDSISRYPHDKLVIITTGSQGEPMSALYRMAFSEHRRVEIGTGDYVIISATPIPGNEKTVGKVVDELLKRGAEVVYEKMYDVHVSGHACQEELKLMHSLIRPKYFMPVHGEYRHLQTHGELAHTIGTPEENIFILENGDALTVSDDSAVLNKAVAEAEGIMVDGLGVGDVGNIVLRDRRLLSESGLIILVAAIDKSTNTIVSGPDIISRGFVYVRENEDLIDAACELAESILIDCMARNMKDWNGMKTAVREGLRKYIYSKTKRNPIILPIFMEV